MLFRSIAVTDILPHTAECVDEMTVIRSMHTEHINHEPALWMMHTGRTMPGRPSMASWVVYGLGSENRNLPAYVVLDDPQGLPVDGIRNWSAGWLPPVYQGTRFRATATPVWNLNPHRSIQPRLEQARRQLLQTLDKAHQKDRPGEQVLDARIASYELAARMQTAAREALDISKETKATQAMYGIDKGPTRDYGTRCLIARRLVERGVRFVQLFLGGQPWDLHSSISSRLPAICRRTDKPSAALVKDLKQRGLLDSTIVHWGGEIGRLPVTQNHGAPEKAGRDHNGQGFSIWLAGGGIKGGITYGETDEFGYHAIKDKVEIHDLHATMLHLLGIHHEELTYRFSGRDMRLTDVAGKVVNDILA